MAQLKGKLLKIYESTIKKYKLGESGNKNLEDLILTFSENDPSGTNKYVSLMVDIMMNEVKFESDVISLVLKYHSVEHKISTKIFDRLDSGVYENTKVMDNPKDIQNYETYNDLAFVYNLAKDYVTKKESSNKIVDEETDMIYDGDDYTIVSPLTFQSSCYWGVDTKWCTTSKENPSYFSDYVNKGTLFYVIDNYRKNDKSHPMSKFAIHVRNSYPLDNADIFNRPDNPMGHGADKVLPKSLVDKLKNYIQNGLYSNLDIYKSFTGYKQNKNDLGLIDDWYQIESDSPQKDQIILFTSKNFPSYQCLIKFNVDERSNSVDMSVKWLRSDEDLKTVILTKPGESIPIRSITHGIRQKNASNIFDKMVDSILAYNKIRLKLLDDVIKNSCANTLFDDWFLDLIDKKMSKSQQVRLFNKGEKSITDLSIYNFSIKTSLDQLNGFSLTGQIDFCDNTFKLSGGESYEINWDDQEKRFQLLYYTEEGIVDVINQFRQWVEDVIKNNSQKMITDLYGDHATIINSKTNSFDDYLNSEILEEIPLPKQEKPKIPSRKPIGGSKSSSSKDINDYLDELFKDLNEIPKPKRSNDNSIILPF